MKQVTSWQPEVWRSAPQATTACSPESPRNQPSAEGLRAHGRLAQDSHVRREAPKAIPPRSPRPEHIADVAKLKNKAVKELAKIIASLRAQLEHHEAKHAELTKGGAKTKAAKPRKTTKRRRLTPAQRAKLPTELSAIIAKNPKGVAVGKISAALPGYPLSSIRKSLKDLIKAKKIKMEGEKALAVYKPAK